MGRATRSKRACSEPMSNSRRKGKEGSVERRNLTCSALMSISGEEEKRGSVKRSSRECSAPISNSIRKIIAKRSNWGNDQFRPLAVLVNLPDPFIHREKTTQNGQNLPFDTPVFRVRGFDSHRVYHVTASATALLTLCDTRVTIELGALCVRHVSIS